MTARRRKTSSRESTKVSRSKSSKKDLLSPVNERNWFVWMDIGVEYEAEVSSEPTLLGRIEIELFGDELPKTCENFLFLCTGEKGKSKDMNVQLSYKGCKFHKIKADYWICGGDITNEDGTGGCSVFGKRFEDEGFKFLHDKYTLSMSNSKPNDNGSQFFISLRKLPYLDKDHVVFGKVIEGFETIDKITNNNTQHFENEEEKEEEQQHQHQKKIKKVYILDCNEKKKEVVPEDDEDDPKNPSSIDSEKVKSRKDVKKKKKKKSTVGGGGRKPSARKGKKKK